MINWNVFKRYREGINNDEVVWFLEDYESVRDGKEGHTGHPEVVTHLDRIEKAIEKPNEVRKDKVYPRRNCYYAWFCGDKQYPNQHMKVVLEKTWYGKIRVVTAYFIAGISSAEAIIWTQK